MSEMEELFDACLSKDIEAVKRALQSKYILENINCTDDSGTRLLEHVHCELELMELLLSHGADPNFEITKYYEDNDFTRVTSLMHHTLEFSSFNQETALKTLELMLRYNASILIKDSWGNTAFYCAFLFRSCLFDKMLAHGCSTPSRFQNFYLLWQCIARDDEQGARTLLAGIEDIDFSDMEEVTPLRVAVALNSVKFAKIFLARGADVNSRETRFVPSILYDATESKNFSLEMVGLLLKFGADVNYIPEVLSGEDDFLTPVAIAAKKGRVDLLKLLLTRNPDLTIRDSAGNTPLLVACHESDSPECVKLLLDHGAKIDDKNEWGETAIDLCSGRNSTAIEEVLLQYGAGQSDNFDY